MKKILTLALAFSCGAALAQKADNVGIGTTKPDPSAILDLNSNTKGLLLPRMNQAQRDAIKNPAAGLVIFQTDQVVGTYTFDGTAWQPSNARTSAVSSVGAWDKQGNAIDGTDFLGSTNNEPLRFRVNNSEQFKINADGSTYFAQNAIGKKITLFDGGSTTNHYGFSISPFQLNYHTFNDGSHVFYKGGNNGNGTEVARLNGGGIYVTSDFSAGPTIFPLAGRSTLSSKNAAFKVENDNGGYVEFGLGGSATPFANTSFFYSPRPNFEIHAGGNPAKMRVTNNGVVVIGSNVDNIPVAGSYKLYVETGILTEKLKVALKSDTNNWADYVFEPNYKLMPLEEVEKYTKVNKHLPNVPSADEITKEGIDVAKVSKMFMEKIEELTLHIIELNKRIKQLEEQK